MSPSGKTTRRARGKNLPVAPVPEAPAPEPAGLQYVCKARILILDDEPAICRVIQEALAQRDVLIEAVSEPARMLAKLQARPPYHLIILDYVIPGLEAETVINWVHRYQPESSVIVVTAHPSIEGVVRCLRAHTYDYLTKPFQVNHLRQVVLRCLESKGLVRMSERALCEALGTAIRDRRKSKGLTLGQLGKRAKLSLGYLSQIERGQSSPTVETIYRVCLGLEIQLVDLFHQVQPPP